MFEFELVMAKRDMATLRAFLEKRVKYTKYWSGLNSSLVHIENMLDVLDMHDGTFDEDEDE